MTELVLRFELVADNGADEGRKKNVALKFAGFGVDGGLWVGVVSTDAGQLRLESLLPGGKFFELLRRGVVGRISRPENAFHRGGSLAKVLVVAVLAGCLRCFVEVARISDMIHLLFAFGNDSTVGSAEDFASVDGSVLLDSAVDFDERVIINRFSHNGSILVNNYT